MNILVTQRIIDRIIERADADGIEAGRKLYTQMADNGTLSECMNDVNAGLMLEGRDELIVDIKEY